LQRASIVTSTKRVRVGHAKGVRLDARWRALPSRWRWQAGQRAKGRAVERSHGSSERMRRRHRRKGGPGCVMPQAAPPPCLASAASAGTECITPSIRRSRSRRIARGRAAGTVATQRSCPPDSPGRRTTRPPAFSHCLRSAQASRRSGALSKSPPAQEADPPATSARQAYLWRLRAHLEDGCEKGGG
jgi:hypothetical protein